MSVEQIFGVRDAFEFFDIDNDGRISGGDINRLLHHLEVDATQEEVLRAVRLLDPSKVAGSLDFTRFLQLQTKAASHYTGPLKRAFDNLDTDADGFLDAYDLHNALMYLDEHCSLDEVHEMMGAVDGGEGKINFDQFMALFGEDTSDAKPARTPSLQQVSRDPSPNHSLPPGGSARVGGSMHGVGGGDDSANPILASSEGGGGSPTNSAGPSAASALPPAESPSLTPIGKPLQHSSSFNKAGAVNAMQRLLGVREESIHDEAK